MSVTEITTVKEYKDAIAKGPVLLDCYASWCGPCIQLAPKLEKLAAEYPDVTVKFDVDEHDEEIEEDELADEIQGLPTLIFYKGGKIVDKAGSNIDKLKEKVARHFEHSKRARETEAAPEQTDEAEINVDDLPSVAPVATPFDASTTGSGTNAEKKHVTEITTVKEYKDAIAKGPVLLDCYASWCGPCIQLAQTLEKLAAEYPDVTFLKFDVDEHDEEIEEDELTDEIQGLPTLIFYKDGKIVDKAGSNIDKLKEKVAVHFAKVPATIEQTTEESPIVAVEIAVPAAAENAKFVAAAPPVEESPANESATENKRQPEAGAETKTEKKSVTEITTVKEYKDAIAKGPVLLDCYASWCGPCIQLAPKLEKLAAEYPDVTFLKFDVDEHIDDDEDELVDEIWGLPTLIFYKDGKIVDKAGANIDKLKEIFVHKK